MKVPILILPTLLAACFVLALSTQTSTPDVSAPISNRAAEIRELHQLLDKASARLAILERLPHNFLPRGASAQDYPSPPNGASSAQSSVILSLAAPAPAKPRS